MAQSSLECPIACGGDMEAHLYDHVFQLVVSLEALHDGPPAFQYILATTTQPPLDLLVEPYLRLRLDGREPKGHLLRRRFK